MKFAPSAAAVKKSLTGHSWLGLMAGILMYLVCLSGTLVVFYPDIERWEQPYVEEFAHMDPHRIERTFNDWLAGGTAVTPHMWFLMPTEDAPRARVATEDESWYVNRDGSLGEPERNDWTELLLDLHLYLHLPESWGMILVSALGAMLCALILSGLIAHPRIFRDAFNLRLKGSRHLEQADIHNRLSVWGLPFHLMIAITGAYFGLALPILAVVADARHGGDREAVVASVFGEEPELEQAVGPHLAIGIALEQLRSIAPAAEPFIITAHDVGEPGQFFAISARHPGRLIYAENYLFDASGRYLGSDGLSDGAAGRQVVYSTYFLHFGHFGGLPVKLAYGLLGLALTVVSVTGINVWLARRRTRDMLNDVWAGLVWGTPAAIALSGLTQVVFRLPSTGILWAAVFLCVVFAARLRDEARCVRWLQRATAGTLALLLIGYSLRFGSDTLSPASLGMNASIAVIGVVFAWLARTPKIPLPRRKAAGDGIGINQQAPAGISE